MTNQYFSLTNKIKKLKTCLYHGHQFINLSSQKLHNIQTSRIVYWFKCSKTRSEALVLLIVDVNHLLLKYLVRMIKSFNKNPVILLPIRIHLISLNLKKINVILKYKRAKKVIEIFKLPFFFSPYFFYLYLLPPLLLSF